MAPHCVGRRLAEATSGPPRGGGPRDVHEHGDAALPVDVVALDGVQRRSSKARQTSELKGRRRGVSGLKAETEGWAERDASSGEKVKVLKE